MHTVFAICLSRANQFISFHVFQFSDDMDIVNGLIEAPAESSPGHKNMRLGSHFGGFYVYVGYYLFVYLITTGGLHSEH